MPVSRLIRTAYGPIRLGELSRGDIKEVKMWETKQLLESLNIKIESLFE